MTNIQEVEILLIEDSEADAELTIRALRKVNLANRLVHLKDGQEALDFLFGEQAETPLQNSRWPRVILLDIKMPKVDGIEVLRRIKQHPATRMIPVVIMTSSREEQDILESYRLGVNSYVVKPLGFEDFARSVSELGLYWLLTNQPPGHI